MAIIRTLFYYIDSIIQKNANEMNNISLIFRLNGKGLIEKPKKKCLQLCMQNS